MQTRFKSQSIMLDDNTASPSKTSGVGKRTRRTHHKSRHGCKSCKLRRIKCDEAKPTCENCIKFRIPCSFNSNSSPPPDVSPPAQDAPRRRGRPRKDWLAATAQSPRDDPGSGTDQTTASFGRPLSEQPPPYLIGDHSLNITDLELLHHYMYKASMNIANAKGPDPFWSVDCPKLGFANPHTLHLIITYSALHMSRNEPDPDRRQALHDEAVLHFATALEQTRLELSRLGADNSHALYVSSMLVCFCTFAKGPSGGDFLMFTSRGGDEPATWLQLVRGVRIIIETMGSPFVFDPDGPLRALVRPRSEDHLRDREEERRLRAKQHRPDWRAPVDALRDHILSLMQPDDINKPHNNACRESMLALEAIRPACMAMWGSTPDAPLERDQETSVYGWLYRLGDHYIRCLERKEQVALVVYAYFALLLKELEVYWFMEGWAEHIIMGIDHFLDDEHRKWLDWPKEQVGLIEIAIKKYSESIMLT